MTIINSLVIIGEIGSGKTTIARFARDILGFTLISFSEYLKNQFDHTPVKRSELQDLGERLVKSDPRQFLIDAIKVEGAGSERLIFDGVRHQSIFDLISKLSSYTLSIYIDATYEQRINRFSKRKNGVDMHTQSLAFEIASKHPVEQETITLKPQSDLIITSNNDENKDFEKVRQFLNYSFKN